MNGPNAKTSISLTVCAFTAFGSGLLVGVFVVFSTFCFFAVLVVFFTAAGFCAYVLFRFFLSHVVYL